MKPETEHVVVLTRRLCKSLSFSQPSHRYREAVRYLGIVPLAVTLTKFPTVPQCVVPKDRLCRLILRHMRGICLKVFGIYRCRW